MVKDLNAYYAAIKAKKIAALDETKATVEAPAPLVESRQEEVLDEQFVTNSHGFDIFKEEEIFYFRDSGTKYTSRNFMKLEDKALELKDQQQPLAETPDATDTITLVPRSEGRFAFESPWGNGTVSVSQLPDKDKIHIQHGKDHFVGEARSGFYFNHPERLKDLIRTNLNTDTVSESHKFREWSNASGKTAYEQLYGDNND